MIGYNPPNKDNPMGKLPNTRVTKNIQYPDEEGFGYTFIVEFQGPEEELKQTDTLIEMARYWMKKENLDFMLEYPIPSIKTNGKLKTRQIKFRNPLINGN